MIPGQPFYFLPDKLLIGRPKLIRKTSLVGIGHVTGTIHKFGEHLVGYFGLVDPEGIQIYSVYRERTGVIILTTHFEFPSRDKDHDHIIFRGNLCTSHSGRGSG